MGRFLLVSYFCPVALGLLAKVHVWTKDLLCKDFSPLKWTWAMSRGLESTAGMWVS